MNPINLQTEMRSLRISSIRSTIKKTFELNFSIDKEKLISEVCAKFICSRRTALDYLNTALSFFDWEQALNEGRVWISNSSSKAPLPETKQEASS